jgi:hypothetical protein
MIQGWGICCISEFLVVLVFSFKIFQHFVK